MQKALVPYFSALLNIQTIFCSFLQMEKKYVFIPVPSSELADAESELSLEPRKCITLLATKKVNSLQSQSFIRGVFHDRWVSSIYYY